MVRRPARGYRKHTEDYRKHTENLQNAPDFSSFRQTKLRLERYSMVILLGFRENAPGFFSENGQLANAIDLPERGKAAVCAPKSSCRIGVKYSPKSTVEVV